MPRKLAKHVLVLSDNREIARAIESILEGQVKIWSLVVEPLGSSESIVEPYRFDLIIMVLSDYTSEPVVALARASLGRLLNRVPLLIISDKSFQPHSDAKIVHMEFPFTAEQLKMRVDEILHGKLLNSTALRRFKLPFTPRQTELTSTKVQPDHVAKHEQRSNQQNCKQPSE